MKRPDFDADRLPNLPRKRWVALGNPMETPTRAPVRAAVMDTTSQKKGESQMFHSCYLGVKIRQDFDSETQPWHAEVKGVLVSSRTLRGLKSTIRSLQNAPVMSLADYLNG